MMRIYVVGALVIALLLAGWRLSVVSNDLKEVEKERDAANASVIALKSDLEKERAEVIRVNNLLASLETKEAEIRYVDKVVTKEVVKYRDRVINRCQLAHDWVCIYNNSAKGASGDCGAIQVQN